VTSTLSRLFKYAKAFRAEARENFTTEALAAAICSDPQPFQRAMSVRAVDDRHAPPTSVRTQVHVPGAGVVDMILTWPSGPTVWIEVKVGAGESGSQLANYEQYIERLAPTDPPVLVVLGPEQIGGTKWISWQEVRDAIRIMKSSSPYWGDFALYLEEIGMANDDEGAFTAGELAGIAHTRGLVGKLTRTLTGFVSGARSVEPGAAWQSDVGAAGWAMLVSKGAFSIADEIQKGKIGVSAGLDMSDGQLGLWVWMKPGLVAEWQRILELAERGGLISAERWSRDETKWNCLGVYRPLGTVVDASFATHWLLEALRDLKGHGVYDYLNTLRR